MEPPPARQRCNVLERKAKGEQLLKMHTTKALTAAFLFYTLRGSPRRRLVNIHFPKRDKSTGTPSGLRCVSAGVSEGLC